jgi:hypothetical protein
MGLGKNPFSKGFSPIEDINFFMSSRLLLFRLIFWEIYGRIEEKVG